MAWKHIHPNVGSFATIQFPEEFTIRKTSCSEYLFFFGSWHYSDVIFGLKNKNDTHTGCSGHAPSKGEDTGYSPT